MPTRKYENQDQAEAYSLYRPDPPEELVDLVMGYVAEKLSPPYSHAIDVACGPGQSTLVLAPHFKRVTGFDISEAQIKEAERKRSLPNIHYKVAGADQFPVADNSIQLVTAATCLHWFDTVNFFSEVQRVLVENGVLAVYASENLYPCTFQDRETDRRLREITNKLFYEDLKPYRSRNVECLFEKYNRIPFPFREIKRTDGIKQQLLSTASATSGYIRSMSTFQNLYDVDPELANSLLEEHTKKIMQIIGKPTADPKKQRLYYQREYFVILCRKSSLNEEILQ